LRAEQLGGQPRQAGLDGALHADVIALTGREDEATHHAAHHGGFEAVRVGDEQRGCHHRPGVLEHLHHGVSPTRLGRGGIIDDSDDADALRVFLVQLHDTRAIVDDVLSRRWPTPEHDHEIVPPRVRGREVSTKQRRPA
jgi:hypothetical protein